MKILININKEDYKIMKHNVAVNNPLCPLSQEEMVTAVANGTPLPAEYGELVDRDAINERFNAILNELKSYSNQPTYKELLDKLSMCLNTAEPIIEANYEEVEEELTDYASLEEKHLGSFEDKTGIYADYDEPDTIDMSDIER